LLKVSRRF